MQKTIYLRKAQFYETDQMGIIHHANYIRWFEEVRMAYTEEMGFGYSQAEALGISFPVLSVSCEYISPVRFGDSVQIHCFISFFSPTRMTVSYRIVDAATGALRTTGESRHCYVNREGRPVSLKRVLPEMYELFCKAVATE